MGFLDKIKSMVNTADNDKYDDGYALNDVEDAVHTPAPAGRANLSAGVSINAAAIELKVVKPERYENVTQIADHLLNHRTVVLNLEATNKETARRVLDFLSGVAYSIDGQLKRVANNTFVITPCNVDVSGDPMRQNESAAAAQPGVNVSSDTLF